MKDLSEKEKINIINQLKNETLEAFVNLPPDSKNNSSKSWTECLLSRETHQAYHLSNLLQACEKHGIEVMKENDKPLSLDELNLPRLTEAQKKWNDRELKQFDKFFADKKPLKYPKAIFSILLKKGYSFKRKKNGNKIPLNELPSCRELIELAEELKEKYGKEPIPDEIFDRWQVLNENQQLNDNIREKLCYKCFSELT